MAPSSVRSQILHPPWRRQWLGIRNRRAAEAEVPLYQAPIRLLALLAVSIFFGELCVMLMLHLFPEPHPLIEALLDAGMLLVIVSPTLYFFLFRPFMHHLQRQQETEAEIRGLSRQLLVATEQERRRIAMDLHDHFGQVLTGLQMDLQHMLSSPELAGTAGHAQCLRMLATARELSEETRRYAAGLRPPLIDELGLVPALEWLIGEFHRQHPELIIDFRKLGLKSEPERETAHAIYRITQEALNNIVKHAQANRVDISVIQSHPILILTIRDDGAGFIVPANAQGGVGLWSMRERAALAGGRLAVTSRPGQGTTVRTELPISTENLGVSGE